MKRAYLSITTFKGSVVCYAEHYYGYLKLDNHRIDVIYPLSAKQAARLNETDWTNSGLRFKRGQECSRFFERDKVIEYGKRMFRRFVKSEYPGYELLILGDNCVCDPQEVLIGPKKVKDQANAIVAEYDHLGGWDNGHDDRINDLCAQYEKIVGSCIGNE